MSRIGTGEMRPIGISDFMLPFRLTYDQDPLKSVIEFFVVPAHEVVFQAIAM